MLLSKVGPLLITKKIKCCEYGPRPFTDSGTRVKQKVPPKVATISVKVVIQNEIEICKIVKMMATEAGLLNKGKRLAPALGVTKFLIAIDMILVTLRCAT